jgi:hypothetical protein
MPSYLDGIASDHSGTPIANGTVALYVDGMTEPSVTTTTDDSGHFVISPDSIPPLAYSLVYTSATGVTVPVDTLDFLKQNKTYNAEHNIDPFVSVSVTPEPTQAASQNRGMTGVNGGTAQKTSSNFQTIPVAGSGTSGAMQGIIMIVVILLVLGIIGVGAYIMMKTKTQSSSQF